MKVFRVSLEGKTYEIAIEEVTSGAAASSAPVNVASAPVSAPVTSSASAPVMVQTPVAVAPAGAITSPMAGMVMKVLVAPGQQVQQNEKIILIEAMKMETPIFAPTAGTVQSILVKDGDAVSEGQALLSIA